MCELSTNTMLKCISHRCRNIYIRVSKSLAAGPFCFAGQPLLDYKEASPVPPIKGCVVKVICSRCVSNELYVNVVL